jgi:hypothetical protein
LATIRQEVVWEPSCVNRGVDCIPIAGSLRKDEIAGSLIPPDVDLIRLDPEIEWDTNCLTPAAHKYFVLIRLLISVAYGSSLSTAILSKGEATANDASVAGTFA